jgi:SAM-dependent methyltransferase
LGELLSLNSHDDFHDYLLDQGVERYASYCRQRGLDLGNVLAICANKREARALRKHAFREIVLSGITEPSEELTSYLAGDDRCRYIQENSECMSLPSRSFDLVICKEGIHHLARPVLGVYEMLRVTRGAILVIEPAETQIGRLLERLGLASIYERNQTGNIRHRDNYVFRWTVKQFDSLLKSYFLESCYVLDVTVGWMSSKFNANENILVRKVAALAGWLAGMVPGSRGNYMTALIFAGSDLPPEPIPLNNAQMPDVAHTG